jgi:hypothetical protein
MTTVAIMRPFPENGEGISVSGLADGRVISRSGPP